MGGGYNLIKGRGFLGTSGADESANAQGVKPAGVTSVNPTAGMTKEEGIAYWQAKTKKDQEDANGTTQLAADTKALEAPSLTDDLQSSARKRALLKLTQGQDRKNSFLTGPVGDLTQPVINKKSLVGA